MLKFLDISSYNTIGEYNSIIKSGLNGIILKASEGTTLTDSTLIEKYSNLKGKIKLGFYHYLTSTSEPETQAQHFYDLIKDKVYQIIPVLDVEDYKLSNKAESYTQRFIDKFKELSKLNMLIYSGRCYIEEYFSDKFCNNNVFWVADYSAKQCPILAECKQIVAWQYTESCQDYPFIDGGVDCSILYGENTFFMKEESNKPTIKNIILELQKELNKQDFSDKHWKELDEDGCKGELTLSACPTIRIGATGNLTKWIQKQIGITADGIYGENTRQAVIQFQKSKSLNTDGVVGKLTWSKLIGL